MTDVRSIVIDQTTNQVDLTASVRGANVVVTEKTVQVRSNSPTVVLSTNQVQVINRPSVLAPVVRATTIRLITLAVRGQQGADGTGAVTIPFEWNSITILPLTIAIFDKTVLMLEVCMVTAFDGAGASLSIGDTANHSRLMTTGEVDPTLEATFSNNPGYRYSNSTQVNLYINPGSGASRGSGVVSVFMEQ